MKEERIITLCDFHCPFEDVNAIELALQFCKYAKPDIVIIHELHDFYDLSKFDKNPERINKLQEEIDIANRYLWAIRKANPSARIILLKSNHLDRLRKYLWREAPALSTLRNLEIENLFELREHNVEYRCNFEYKNFLFKHGSVIRKFAGYTAKAELEKEGMSGASGHSHRRAVYNNTKRGGEFVWIESGCLCSLTPEYSEDEVMDWQAGISMVTFKENHFHAEVIPIISRNKLLYGGLTFKLPK